MTVNSPFHTGVSLRGFHFEDFSLTVKLHAGITADDVGKALSVDGTNPNQLKLAADGDVIVARLATVESRTVEGTLIGAAEFKFSNLLPIKSGETVVAGDTVIGAGSGTVKTLKDDSTPAVSAPDYTQNWVAEVVTIGSTTYAVVVKL